MANVLISDLTENTNPAVTDWLEMLTSGGLSRKVSMLNFLNKVYGGFVLTSGMWVSITSGGAGAVKQEMSTNKQNCNQLQFVNGSTTYYECAFPMPADYNGGTVAAVFYWSANSASTNSVTWGLQARCYADGDAIDQAWGTAQEVSDANGASAFTQRISSATSAITIGGSPAANQLVRWRAYRKTGDTLAVTALLDCIQIGYTRA
jgi:hypothetical protein